MHPAHGEQLFDSCVGQQREARMPCHTMMQHCTGWLADTTRAGMLELQCSVGLTGS